MSRALNKRLVPYPCTFAVVVMATILSVLAGHLGLHGCGILVGLCAVFSWGIAIRLATLCG